MFDAIIWFRNFNFHSGGGRQYRDCAIRCDMAWTTRILHLSVCYFLSSNIMAVFINVTNYDHSCLFRTINKLKKVPIVLGTNRPWVGVPVQVRNVFKFPISSLSNRKFSLFFDL